MASRDRTSRDRVQRRPTADSRGRLIFLPDTAGVSYKLDHVKTGIVPQMLDIPGAGCGTSTMRVISRFRATISMGYSSSEGSRVVHVPLPYVEVVRLDRLRRPDQTS